jgi:GntR family transcriptional repressor for pyruvate dehydrogenase complex
MLHAMTSGIEADDPDWSVVRAERLFEKVANRLEADIMHGRLAPGEKLPNETELSRRFKVGRSAVREGLKTLELRGLLEVRRGFNGGTFVRPPDLIQAPHELHMSRLARAEDGDLLRVRLALEPLAARLAAELSPGDTARRLGQLVRRERETADYPARFIEAAAAFHQEIAEASASALLLTLMDALGTLVQMELNVVVLKGATGLVVAGHSAIRRAIASGEGDAAAAAMAEHLRATHPAALAGHHL